MTADDAPTVSPPEHVENMIAMPNVRPGYAEGVIQRWTFAAWITTLFRDDELRHGF